MTEHRRQWMERILNFRTRHFTMVLEDLYDPHNISAVIRTSEVFGLQDAHIIEEVNPYNVNKSILKGAIKWMDLHLYQQRQTCFTRLKELGYTIAVASTNTENSVLDLDLSKPTAFYLGSEYHGNHPDTLAQADAHFKLPQYGVTESMNVSVAAGVLMTYLDMYMQKVGRQSLTLDEDAKNALRKQWYMRQVEGMEKHSPITRW
ncbi:MAG: RNA methyltransferase [Fibrobacter sp.]|nr:RNA methyltransferase [Fibrobacter sp.]